MSAPAAGLILAAGLSRRFGSDKLSAPLAGKPLLQHVIDAAAGVPLMPLVVIINHVERRLEWRGARPVANPDPGRGISSSLRLGLDELAREPTVERVVVLLGDQPRVSAAVIQRLLEVADRPLVVPRYGSAGPGNPVVLDRSVWPLAATLSGDRGMSQLFGSRPDLIAYIDVSAANPDVDTPGDLDALEARWRPSG